MLFYTHLHYLNNGGRVPIAKANKRISAPYSIWKILAHAQYYVKLARVLFSRDFFATKQNTPKKHHFYPSSRRPGSRSKMLNFGIIQLERFWHTRDFFSRKNKLIVRVLGKINRRISASYSILKILAHAQYYVKLARVLFSRDFFFANKQIDCRAGYSSSGKQDGNWQRSVL